MAGLHVARSNDSDLERRRQRSRDSKRRALALLARLEMKNRQRRLEKWAQAKSHAMEALRRR